MNEEYIKKAERYFDDNGLLTQYPSKRPVREIVLERIAEKLVVDKDYTEKEVNRIIQEQISFSDIELIRRELYEYGFIGRERDGSRYWKILR